MDISIVVTLKFLRNLKTYFVKINLFAPIAIEYIKKSISKYMKIKSE